ncbi:MAG: T9SS type A sorting domain-containing protein [bacterium]|nr:T9SS type A sorting domain-containing protein [bacterium]
MKRLGWILLLSLTLTGAATATPRWGDDFDWLGDTLAITVPLGMIAFGDTIVCHTPNNMFAMLQTDNHTFQKLWQMNIPRAVEMPYNNYYSTSNRFCHILRRGNRFYYGWPKAMIEWNGNDAPVYRGAIRNGLQFTPDTAFTAGDLYSGQYYRSYKPVQVNNMILVADRIFRIDSLTNRIVYTGSARANEEQPYNTEWAVRWPYAYGVTTTHHVAVVKLDTTPPQTVHRFDTIFQPVFCRIINDSLVIGGGWSVWSLENPRIPQFVGNNSQFPGIDYLWEEPVDSVWFGWRGPNFYLISLAQGLLAPMIVDTSRPYGPNEHSIPSCNVAKTSYGWIVHFGNVWSEEPKFAQLRQYRDAQHHQRLDTLWNYRQPVGFDSIYFAYYYYQEHPEVRLGKEGKAIVTRGRRKAIFVADTVNARHHMRWLPQGIYPIAIDGEQVLASGSINRQFHLLTWSNSSWLDQTFQVPDSVTSSVELFRSNLVVLQGNSQYPFPVYRFQDGELVSDGVLSFQPITMRESSAILDIGDSIRWYRKQGGVWLPQNWSVPGSGYAITQGDTFTTSGGQIYALQRNAAPILVVDSFPFGINAKLLQSKSCFNLQERLDSYHGIYTRYDHTWQGWVERGTFMSGIPFLYYGSMLLTMTPGAISTYRMPPNNATPELIGTLPFDFALSNPYPNPFNSTITFQVDLPRSAMTGYAIYDALGREVYANTPERLSLGSYTLHWNGLDNSGIPASSGIYFIQVRAGTFSAVKKVIMLK